MQARAAEFAGQGVYLGTSSWKYEGWLGQLYSPDRYEYRGKVDWSSRPPTRTFRTCPKGIDA